MAFKDNEAVFNFSASVLRRILIGQHILQHLAGLGIAPVRRRPEPLHRLRLVIGNPFAVEVHQAELKLRLEQSLLGGFPAPEKAPVLIYIDPETPRPRRYMVLSRNCPFADPCLALLWISSKACSYLP